MLSKTFSVFKSAKQIGLKGLLAGVEKGPWGCEPRLVVRHQAGKLSRWKVGGAAFGKQQQAGGGGASDRTGAARPHCQE